MAANRSLEEQKKKLHSILLSRRDGYTNTAHILRDLRDDFGHDGIALAQAHGYHSFQTFLESASMREYCRCAEELRTTTVYYGIGTEQTEHIEREMQISLAAKLEKLNKDMKKLRRQIEAKDSEILKMSHTVEKMAERLKNAEKRPNGTMESDSNGPNLRRQVGFLKRSDLETSDISGDPRSVTANLTTKETNKQTDQDEKAVQTEGGEAIQFQEKLQNSEAQLQNTEAKLQNSEAQLQQISEENQQLNRTRPLAKFVSRLSVAFAGLDDALSKYKD